MNISVSNDHGEITARVGRADEFNDEGDPSIIMSYFEGNVAWIDRLSGRHIGGGATLLQTLLKELKQKEKVRVVGLMAVPSGADPGGRDKPEDRRIVRSLTKYYERFGFRITNDAPWDYFPVMLLDLGGRSR